MHKQIKYYLVWNTVFYAQVERRRERGGEWDRRGYSFVQLEMGDSYHTFRRLKIAVRLLCNLGFLKEG